MKTYLNNVNIRGCVQQTNKNGEEYLLVRIEDESGEPAEIVDKDINHQPMYKRNTEGDMVLNITFGKYTSVRVKEFTPYNKA